MNKTTIGWCDFSANPLKYRTVDGRVVWACEKVSAGCTHCYAEALSHRYGGIRRAGEWNAGTMAGLTPFLDEAELKRMLTLKAAPGKRVFVGDMTDIFGEWVPDDLLDKLFAVFALRPDVTWQILSKRTARMLAYVLSAKPRIAALVEAHEAGRSDLADGQVRGTRNRLGGPNLARKEAQRRSVEGRLNSDAVQAGSGGVALQAGLSHSERPLRVVQSTSWCASSRLGRGQWSDTEHVDDQPHQRHQGRQSPIKSGVGDAVAAKASRSECPKGEPEQTYGFAASKDPHHRTGCGRYSADEIRRGDVGGTCRSVSDEATRHLRDLCSEDLAPRSLTWPLPNVWLGVSAENQEQADARIPLLLQTPAAVRFISAEPLLGPVDLSRYLESTTEVKCCGEDGCEYCDGTGTAQRSRIHWIIAGGESGGKARHCHTSWLRWIVEQCVARGTACFVKQMGTCVIERNDRLASDRPAADADDWPEPEEGWDDSSRGNLIRLDDGYQGAPVRILLKDRKGGDPSEWPMALRVRQFPCEDRR